MNRFLSLCLRLLVALTALFISIQPVVASYIALGEEVQQEGWITLKTAAESTITLTTLEVVEGPMLQVDIPEFFNEGDGLFPSAGCVFIPEPLSEHLLISLATDRPSKVTVEPAIGLFAGQSFACFDLTILEDAIYDGTVTVTITAQAASFSSGSSSLRVLDNDPPTVNNAGDIDHNLKIDLTDVLLIAQTITGIYIPHIYRDADVDDDKRIGTAELIYVLQVLAGLRTRDVEPPEVGAISPANDAIDVLTSESINVTFNETLQPSSLNLETFQVKTPDGTLIEGVIAFVPGGGTFTPVTPFAFNTYYTIILHAGIQDTSGNAMPADFESTFRTVALPAVVATSPPQGSENAAINTGITITFNNPIEPASVTDTSFMVTQDGEQIDGAITAIENIITFTPSEALSYNTEYHVVVGDRIQDRFGSRLHNPYEYSFKTTAVIEFFTLDLSIDDVVFDPSGKFSWCSSKKDKKMYLVNLETAQIEKEFAFDYMAESIAVRPDQKRMYVALLAQEHSPYWHTEDQYGYLAEFDLERREEIKEFRINLDPYDLVATNDGFVYVAGGSGQWTNIAGFEAATQSPAGQFKSIYQKSHIQIHPSEMAIYLTEFGYDIERFDIATGTISRPYNALRSAGEHVANGDLFVDPAGGYLVTAAGDLYSLGARKETDVQFIQRLTSALVYACDFDALHGYIFTGEQDAIRYYDRSDFSLAGRIAAIPADKKNFLHLTNDSQEIRYVAAGEAAVTFYRLQNPTSRGNDLPVADFSFSPESGSTAQAFRFDASLSSDNIPNETLLYSWDWDSDGSFDTWPSTETTFYHSFPLPGTIQVTLKVTDRWGLSNTFRKSVTVTGAPVGDFTLQSISDMAAGNDPEFVYALDRGQKALYYINVLSRQIVRKVSLPYEEPVAMTYSAPDNSLYIISYSSGPVVVYNLDDGTLSELPSSFPLYGRDIEVATTLRRLYVLSVSKYGYESFLSILDMDSGEVLQEAKVDGTFLALDENRRKIFTAEKGSSSSSLNRYAVDSDTVTLEQTRLDAGDNGQSIAISPDGLNIIFPCGGGNSYGYNLFDFDATDLNNVLGEWDIDIDTYPKLARFSPDGTKLFVSNGDFYDNSLYIMDTANHQQLARYSYPEGGVLEVLTINTVGTVAVGFSYDTYYNPDPRLHFIYLPTPLPKQE